MWTKITALFMNPKARHILAAVLIIGAILTIDYFDDRSTAKQYKAEIERLDKDKDYLIQVVADIANVPKYSIENKIEGIRKKANVTLIPDNEITHIGDNEIEPEPKKKRKKFLGIF